jgi:hypothetical protein
MRWQVQWTDEPEVFDLVTEALDNWYDDQQDGEISIDSRNEEDSYGDRGYIFITMPNGDRFSLQLNKESY